MQVSRFQGFFSRVVLDGDYDCFGAVADYEGRGSTGCCDCVVIRVSGCSCDSPVEGYGFAFGWVLGLAGACIILITNAACLVSPAFRGIRRLIEVTLQLATPDQTPTP